MTSAEPKLNAGAERALIELLGEARVRGEPHLPGVFVASIRSAEEVRELLAVARRFRLPIRPHAAGLETTLLKPPAGGGILLDLRGMNRILEVNHSERYALVEPGVTWRQLYKRLAEDGGDLALPTAATPRGLSVWASTFMEGAAGAALVRGALPEKIWGVEAILSSGETVRTGSAALVEGWWGRGPLPDTSGLFLGWQGATGVVTRLSVSLRPQHRHFRRMLVPASTRRVAIAAAIRLAREGLFDESTVLPWLLFRRTFGVEGPLKRHPGEPESYLHVDLTADTLPELEYKRLRLSQNLVRAARRGGSFDEVVDLNLLSRVAPMLKPLRDLPLKLPLGEASSLRAVAVGCQGPISRLVDAADLVEEAAGAEGVSACTVVRPMRGAHFGVLHVAFDGGTDGVAAAETAAERAVERLLPLGFVPHRYPPRCARLVGAKLHAGTKRLSLRLRRLLDQEGLLDPAAWGLPAAF